MELPWTDEAQIYEVLNALAGKLYYDAYKTGEEKLTGQATIARRTDLIIQDLGNERHALQERKRTGICAGKTHAAGRIESDYRR